MDEFHVAIVVFISLLAYQQAAPGLLLTSPAYVNHGVKILCNSGNITGLDAVEITISKGSLVYHIHCRQINGTWYRIGSSDKLVDNCAAISNRTNITLILQGPLIEEIISSSVVCNVYNQDSRVRVKTYREEKAFDNPFFAPLSVKFDKFEFDDAVPVLNRTVRGSCKSSGGWPPSAFIYYVRDRDGYLVYSITLAVTNLDGSVSSTHESVAEFHINEQLKTGFRITCEDAVHSMGVVSLTKDCTSTGSDQCMPYYVSPKLPMHQDVAFNSTEANSLLCEVDAYPFGNLSFLWWRNGQPEQDVNSTYSLEHDPGVNVSTEFLTCKASVFMSVKTELNSMTERCKEENDEIENIEPFEDSNVDQDRIEELRSPKYLWGNKMDEMKKADGSYTDYFNDEVEVFERRRISIKEGKVMQKLCIESMSKAMDERVKTLAELESVVMLKDTEIDGRQKIEPFEDKKIDYKDKEAIQESCIENMAKAMVERLKTLAELELLVKLNEAETDDKQKVELLEEKKNYPKAKDETERVCIENMTKAMEERLKTLAELESLMGIETDNKDTIPEKEELCIDQIAQAIEDRLNMLTQLEALMKQGGNDVDDKEKS